MGFSNVSSHDRDVCVAIAFISGGNTSPAEGFCLIAFLPSGLASQTACSHLGMWLAFQIGSCHEQEVSLYIRRIVTESLLL